MHIYPTLCHLTGIPKPAHLQGSNLFDLLKDPHANGFEKATSYWKNRRSEITSTEHKIYDNKSNTLLQHYNLKTDPEELNNLTNK